MDFWYILYWVLIGAAAGWITGRLLKGRGFGTVGNIILGIAGALLGGFAVNLLNITLGDGLFGNLISAVIGAFVVLFIVGLIKRGRKA